VIGLNGPKAVPYTLDHGTVSYSLPQGFAPAAIQTGDVAATGMLLLERPSASSNISQVGST
jgi:hypothetical protein